MKIRKWLSGAVIVAVTMTTCVPAFAGTQSAAESDLFAQESNLEKVIEMDPSLKALDQDDEIRIMVEVKADAAIDVAQDRGVSLSALDEKTVESVESDVQEAVNEVKQDVKENALDVDIISEYSDVFSGFAAVTTIEDAKAIEKLPNVEHVYISKKYYLPKPQMVTSNDMIRASETWKHLKFKGEGTVVAVLDSSFAPDHPDMMKITDMSRAVYKSASDLPSGLPGQWYNAKMPYCYNYYDNNDVLESESEHGTHVAGTVGANGVIKGVAPETQILGMKVFGNDPNMPSTFDDVYIRAIEDALKLGADAINMSLGSTAGFLAEESEDPTRIAIRKASENGTIVVISAGNSDRFGSGYDMPYVANPDTGVVGAPSLNPYSLSVASINNTHVTLPSAGLTLTSSAGVIVERLGYNMVDGSPDPVDAITSGGAVEVVYVGTGEDKYYDGLDVSGKFVLVVRTGGHNYSMIKASAQSKGAAGIIVRGHESHGDYVSMNPGTEKPIIPMMSLSIAQGDALAAELKAGSKMTVNFFDKQLLSTTSTTKGTMSDFTSWGTTPSLDFKPEITAPGGNIYSTNQHGKYGPMSGTSMAAPHVSGAVGVLMQRLAVDYPSLKGIDRYKFAKNILMSTAVPLQAEGEVTFTSPRRGGAGVMDLYAACSGDVIVVNPETQESKVNLREIDNNVSFPVEVQNHSNEPVTYTVSATIQTDFVEDGYILEKPDLITDAKLSVDQDTITVPAHGKATVNVSFDMKDAKLQSSGKAFTEVYTNGGFVDGFVQFKASNDAQPNVVIPYVGFYGDWTKAPVIDAGELDSKGNLVNYYGKAVGLYDLKLKALSKFNDRYYLSPAKPGEKGDGLKDVLVGAFTFLRNAKNVEINILNENKEVVRELAKTDYVRKNYFDGTGAQITARNEWIWDGVVNNTVKDGEYFYQVRAKVDSDKAQWQSLEFPITVDTAAPVIQNIAYNEKTGELKVDATDNTEILVYYASDVNGKEIAKSYDGTFKLAGLVKTLDPVVIEVVDVAWNIAEQVTVLGDKQAPKLDMPLPEALEYNNETEVVFKGSIKENAALKSLTICGQPVKFTFDKVAGVNNFEAKLALPEGRIDAEIIAVDYAGNTLKFRRVFYHDTQAPKINMKSAFNTKVNQDQTTYELVANVTDNCTGFTVSVDGNVIKTIAPDTSFLKEPKEVSYEMKKVVNLKPGMNEFVVEAVDPAGNGTAQVVKIERAGNVVGIPSVTTTVKTIGTVNYERPFVVEAAADKPLEWTFSVYDPANTLLKQTKVTGDKFAGKWSPDELKKLNGNFKAVLSYTDGKETGEKSFNFTVYNYPLEIIKVVPVKRGNLYMVEATVGNTGVSTQNPMLVIQVMNAEGQVVSINSTQLDGLEAGKSITMNAGFILPSNGEYTADVYVWDGWNSPKSLSGSEQVKIKY